MFPRARSKVTPTLNCGVALVVLLVVMAGCARDDAAAGGPKAVSVSVMEARPALVPQTLDAVGQVEGSKEVDVRARVGGILLKRLYQEGAPVKAGQALFEIDRVPYEIALAQAKGQLAEAQARATQATREAARLKGLLEQRAISHKEFDDATANHAVAEASMKSAAAAARQAELNLSYTTVTAPVGGISGRAQYSEGALVGVGADSLLTTVVQANPVWVRFGVADSDLAAFRGSGNKRRAIAKVEALLSDGSSYASPGRLNFESAEVDRQLGTMSLRAEFDNRDGVLVPGQFVRVRLQTGGRNAVLVPQSVLQQTERGAMVLVVGDDGKAQARPVQTDGWLGTDWVVVGGLKAGDRIIVDNLLKLKPGAPVTVDAANDAAAEKSAPTSAPAAAAAKK